MLCYFVWQPQCQRTSIYGLPRLPSSFMVCAVGSIEAISKCYIHSILLSLQAPSFCAIFLCSVRVSNELGRGNAEAVKFSIKVITATSTILGVIFFVLCLAFGRQLSYLFTSSEEVAESVSNLSVFLAFSLLLNSIQTVLTGN